MCLPNNRVACHSGSFGHKHSGTLPQSRGLHSRTLRKLVRSLGHRWHSTTSVFLDLRHGRPTLSMDVLTSDMDVLTSVADVYRQTCWISVKTHRLQEIKIYFYISAERGIHLSLFHHLTRSSEDPFFGTYVVRGKCVYPRQS
jgi:hypothetical protein